ncbi:hypothetical protein FS842_009330 [Serendipita sp. 407]|nr:hypothetical protein FS842_009330 [Serendipita sp. 407]
MDVRYLIEALTKDYKTLKDISFKQIILFADICSHLRPLLQRKGQLVNPDVPPLRLYSKVHHFLVDALSEHGSAVDFAMVDRLWTSLSRLVWKLGHKPASKSLLSVFLEHGIKHDIGFVTIMPPVDRCMHPDCHETPLRGDLTYKATLFTLEYGPIPVYPFSQSCSNCRARYYNNYFVHSQQEERTFYPLAVPSIIHVSTKFFVDTTVCELFANMMMMACRIYNLALGDHNEERRNKLDWKPDMKMDREHVSEGFYIHALLLDYARRGEDAWRECPLTLPHSDTSNRDGRFRDALTDHNHRFSGYLRPDYNHVCDGCAAVVERDGQSALIRSMVTDGIVMGHPCCSIHDCKNPLPSTQSRFCSEHQDQENLCATVGCSNAVLPGSKACGDAVCQRLEQERKERGKAMFQLKERLSQHREQSDGPVTATTSTLLTAAMIDSAEGIGSEEWTSELVGEFGAMDVSGNSTMSAKTASKATGSNKKPKAVYGRKRTACEVLAVLSCGTIVGRTTMYGSEAVTGVIKFWEHLFPTLESLPTYMWYDNNCRVKRALEPYPNHRLNKVALPVDVFHFKAKHSKKDAYCGQHCNAANFPELMDGEKWRFNSSAAEQANAWMAGFLAIVREMRKENFNFFLDEMIRRHNEWLRQEQKNPRTITLEALVGAGHLS